MKKDILYINALLKYIEFLLHHFDCSDEKMTLKELKKIFETQYHHNDILLNQYFGIIRLMPLILIKEEYKNQKKELKDDIKKIKIMRDAVSHNNFYIDENGYSFKNNKGEIKMTYPEFQIFLHKIENEFYKE